MGACIWEGKCRKKRPMIGLGSSGRDRGGFFSPAVVCMLVLFFSRTRSFFDTTRPKYAEARSARDMRRGCMEDATCQFLFLFLCDRSCRCLDFRYRHFRNVVMLTTTYVDSYALPYDPLLHLYVRGVIFQTPPVVSSFCPKNRAPLHGPLFLF